MEKAERLLEEAGAEDAEDLVNAIEAVRDALARRRCATAGGDGRLADLLYYLES